jgi:DNA invertase Pin-like site-specific DNA recombinase
MKIGYARVSTDDQTLALQQDALKKAGCDRVFTDVASGVKRDRAGLEEALSACGKGDVLVVWKLDRMGRSLTHLLETAERLKKKGAAFVSLTEGIDATTACGEMIFCIMGSMAQFERRLIRERTMAGLAAARQRGRIGGRKRQTDPVEVWSVSQSNGGDVPVVCQKMGISQATYYRAMKEVAL